MEKTRSIRGSQMRTACRHRPVSAPRTAGLGRLAAAAVGEEEATFLRSVVICYSTSYGSYGCIGDAADDMLVAECVHAVRPIV